ncbi:TPA: InlB B-repeat-containing protein [Candidatus Ventrenecus stercoripullorum]|nr:InlB B-repeat-containing protein [Candidatus Ventrenecus stercoripullorum]
MKKKKWLIITVVIVLIILITAIALIINVNRSKEPKMVTITFLGKNEEIIRVETIEKGSLVEQKDPEETLGFSGWFTEEEIPFDFTKPVEKDITIHAEYGAIDENLELFLVLLIDNKYYNTIKVKPNEIATTPEIPTKEGYTFVGWYENDTLFDFSNPITKDHTLNAVFAQNN